MEFVKSKFSGQEIDNRLSKVTQNETKISQLSESMNSKIDLVNSSINKLSIETDSKLETKINKTDIATINGQSIIEGGDIEIDLTECLTSETVSSSEPTANFPHVLYTPQSLTNEQKAQVRKNIGVGEGIGSKCQTDWSSEPSIKLPMPKYCAKVNINSNEGLSISKTDIKSGTIEFWDRNGNYFKKYIKFHAQGTSSMLYIEKNQTIDIFNDKNCTESCDIVFGNWVSQDSFHLKAYYIDVFRGVSNMVYNLYEEVIKYMDSRNNRLTFNDSTINVYNSTGDFAADFGDGALCHPDGFPFELYLNGEYYGLYAWNLKKHRKNYSMNKNDYTYALFDGVIDGTTFFRDEIDWTAFELRNPKNLVTMDGQVYDADTNCNELIDETSSYYDASNSTHVNTAQLKKLIIRQSNSIYRIIDEPYGSYLGREYFEEYYDFKAMACYFILSNVLYNYDGFSKNWIWTMYNNIMAPSFYDMDTVFGRWWDGTYIVENSTSGIIGDNEYLPTGQLLLRYKNELSQLYKEMRDNGILSVDNIMKHVYSWIERVGFEAYNKNNEKWNNIPSYRSEKKIDDGTNPGGFYDSPKRIKLWLIDRLNYLDEFFA